MQHFAFMQTFAAEGGLKPAVNKRPDGTEERVVAGITEEWVIKPFGEAVGIAEGTQSEDLTNIQRTKLMSAYLNDKYTGFGFAGGLVALDTIADKEVVAVLVDTMFRKGDPATGYVLQGGLNAVLATNPALARELYDALFEMGRLGDEQLPEKDRESVRLTADGQFGVASLAAWRLVAQDAIARRQLLDEVAQRRFDFQRCKLGQSPEATRYRQFAFSQPGVFLQFNSGRCPAELNDKFCRRQRGGSQPGPLLP